jgi:hypothetical protein
MEGQIRPTSGQPIPNGPRTCAAPNLVSSDSNLVVIGSLAIRAAEVSQYLATLTLHFHHVIHQRHIVI